MTEHLITPPPELVQQWRNAAPPLGLNRENWIATQAARWGADQQLNADCEWLDNTCCDNWDETAAELRAAMRPKPPSLKEQALAELEEIMTELHDETGSAFTASNIRRALEALPE